jgi:predicted Mrr-cat superfamily restriction endonuclease
LEVGEHAKRALSAQPAKAPGHGSMLYRFAHEVAVQDHVVTPDGLRGELLFGLVMGPYEYLEDPPVAGFSHLRRVRWLDRLGRSDVPPAVLPALGAPMAVFRPAAQEALRALDIWEKGRPHFPPRA